MIQLDAASQENASSAEALSKASADADIEASNMSTVVGQIINFVFGQKFNVEPQESVASNIRNISSRKPPGPKHSPRKVNLDLCVEPADNKIKKVENF